MCRLGGAFGQAFGRASRRAFWADLLVDLSGGPLGGLVAQVFWAAFRAGIWAAFWVELFGSKSRKAWVGKLLDVFFDGPFGFVVCYFTPFSLLAIFCLLCQ